MAWQRRGDPLQEIPGIGPSLSKDLQELGYNRVPDLVRADPEEMYARLIHIRGEHQDRCVLYVFRCAVYYASTADHDPELLKWWAWKGRELVPRTDPVK
ncbi:MAG: helix-hairpin-helix domain-containing protein [Gemmatimonadetes bacterium]|nr:helix-hairpin-helix domain-containing protein [Gemmatimonadota bacterium]